MADLTLTRTGGPWKITTVRWTRSTDPMDGIVNAICCIEISVPHWWDSRCHERRYLWSAPRYLLRATFSLKERERERACEWRKLFQNVAQFRETDVVEVAKKYLWGICGETLGKFPPFFFFRGSKTLCRSCGVFVCFLRGRLGGSLWRSGHGDNSAAPCTVFLATSANLRC
jgi:hypothetical protein